MKPTNHIQKFVNMTM